MARGDWSVAPLERRIMNAQGEGSGVDGAYLVPAPISARTIDLMRDKTSVIQAGAVTIPMVSRTLDLAKVTAAPAVHWRAELAPITQGNVGIGRVQLVAHTCGVVIAASEELLMDAPNSGVLLQNQLAAALAEELARVALQGSGSGAEPTGLSERSGTEHVGTVGVPTDYAEIVTGLGKLWGNAAQPNALILPAPVATVYAGLQDTTHQPLNRPTEVQALQWLISSRLAVDGSPASWTGYLGQFDQMVIGLRTGVQLAVAHGQFTDNASASQDAFAAYTLRIRATMRVDVELMQDGAFCRLDGIETS
jgi:HK97 family phage major capsid protein